MKLKKLTAFLLVAAMGMTMLSGCGATEEEPDGGSEVSDGGSEDADEGEEAGEPDEITVALMCLAPMDESQTDHVEEALNELLLDKINVQADFMWFDATTYATQVPMMIQASEDLDLMMFNPVPATSYQSFMSQNQLMDITEYVEEYGDNIQAEMGDYLAATSRDGKIYGVGNMTSLAAYGTICMRKDTLEDLGLTEKAEKMASWSEYEEILKEVVKNTDLNGVTNSDAEGTCITPQPFMTASDKFADSYAVDTLGDSNMYVYGDPETKKVNSYFDSEEWYESIKRANEFYKEGLLYKDASTTQDYGDNLVKNGVGFSTVKQTEDGSQSTFEATIGHEAVLVNFAAKDVETGSFTKFGFGVPVTAKNPEAAVKLLNLLQSDTEVLDMITWGVEGVDYAKNDDGTLTYPEGVTSDTVQYHTGDFLYGNRLKVTPWEGEGADVRDRQKAGNDEMEKSVFFGFSVDPTPVTSEITSCKNVIDQYKPQLSAGIVDDVDATYEQFKSALSAAGMDKILEEYQSQLDSWLAEQ